MKSKYRRWVVLTSTALVGGGILTAAIDSAATKSNASNGNQLTVMVDPSPPDRDGRLATSYAPVLEKSSAAVVNIFTAKTVRAPRGMGVLPFSDDPLFRRFFGDQFGRGGGSLPRSFTQNSLGSGVIVTEDGYVLTNNHVVDGADEIKVALEKSRKEYVAKVIGRDPQTDIAVLKIEAENLPAATFANSAQVRVGDVVMAIGNPFGIGQTVTLGIVSAVGRGGMGIEAYEDFIQTDAAINPGNSGGALVDTQGRLIGLNTAILSRTGGNHGVGFAIPADLVRSVMNQLVETGEVQRGFLGVGIQDITPELAEAFELKDYQGALVSEVTANSAADKAGVKRGDVIIELDGKPVEDSRSLKLRVAEVRPGSEVDLKVLRDGKTRTLTATLNAIPGTPETARSLRDDSPTGQDEGALAGVGVGDLTPDLRREYDIPEELEGVLITQVDPDSDSYRAGLRTGDVILEIERQRVRNVDEALEACRASVDGTTLVNFWRQGGHRYLVVKEDLPKE